MRHAHIAVLLALAACSPSAEPNAAPTARPAAKLTNFNEPITARGTEPFWALRKEGLRFTLVRPEQADLVAEAPGASMAPGRGTWEAKAADGQTLRVSFYDSPCSDGMSDLAYPMTAEVEMGGSTLRGCAAKTAELPREGG
jgi:uncharacterized membrane protein